MSSLYFLVDSLVNIVEFFSRSPRRRIETRALGNEIVTNTQGKSFIREPMLLSKRELFKNMADCPIGATKLGLQQDALQPLIPSAPTTFQDKNGTIEIVDNFRFVIKAEDLQRVKEHGSTSKIIARGNNDEMFSFNDEIISLLDRAEKFERDGKFVYRIEMDHEDLLSQISRVNQPQSLLEEREIVKTQKKSMVTPRKTVYDESRMMLADKNILSKLKRFVSASTAAVGHDRVKSPPLKLSVAEMTSPEIAENLIGTAFCTYHPQQLPMTVICNNSDSTSCRWKHVGLGCLDFVERFEIHVSCDVQSFPINFGFGQKKFIFIRVS